MAKNQIPMSKTLTQNMAAKARKKKIILSVLGVLVVGGIITSFITVKQNRERDRIAKAKNAVLLLDTNMLIGEPDFPDEGDWDGDGVTNKNEVSEKTNIQSEDTDGDGISDGDELAIGTDPLNEDTDNDTLLDGYEIMVGLNPRNASTDGKNDSQTEVTATRREGQITVDLRGNANICNTTVEELELFGIAVNGSIVSKAYDVYGEYPFKSATVTFKLDSEKIRNLGYKPEDLTVLSFDSSTLQYEKVSSRYNKKDNTISADINKFTTYVVGVEKTVNQQATTRIAFLVDDSGSMYSKSFVQNGFTTPENDTEFKRIDFANSLIGMIEDNVEIMISKYTAQYTRLVPFTTDKKSASSALEKIKNETLAEKNFNGTYSQRALENCMAEFTQGLNGNYRNILVMLTDGQSDETNAKTAKQLAALAKKKNIIILTVGLGKDVDREWLQEMASETGGKYFTASDANALNEVYNQIVTALNYDIVNYNDTTDSVRGYSLYNTNFAPSANGFTFKNFRTTTTRNMDFGMALMARDWYLGNLRLSMPGIDPKDDAKDKVSTDGYDLTGTAAASKYNSNDPLSKVTVSALGSKFADVSEYLDYNSEGSVLQVEPSVKTEAEDSGWKAIEYDTEGLDWSKVEFLALDIAGGADKIKDAYSKDDVEFLKALYHYNAMQWDDSKDEYNLIGGSEGFERLQEQLSKGIPVVTMIDNSHAVNAIGLIQDSDNHNEYVLQIYDSNYPSDVQKIYITKNLGGVFDISGDKATFKDTKFTFNATYEGKQVGLSFTDVQVH
ncbi:VWA domain-containing protein [Ruminococcus sp. NK3A76]|uniref:vWA domain-containing protein n=1 Tax=Ruminococcus sp. NK3A76 TaxID=877411 RepID=UPI000491BAD4|nr:VWA domain-containing protein [Ruminococcus sp. NK3A76]